MWDLEQLSCFLVDLPDAPGYKANQNYGMTWAGNDTISTAAKTGLKVFTTRYFTTILF